MKSYFPPIEAPAKFFDDDDDDEQNDINSKNSPPSLSTTHQKREKNLNQIL